MSDALIAPTYGEAFELRRQFRLLYGNTLALDYLFAAVAPTGAQLEAWLATEANLAAYQRLIATAVGASAHRPAAQANGLAPPQQLAGGRKARPAVCGPGRRHHPPVGRAGA